MARHQEAEQRFVSSYALENVRKVHYQQAVVMDGCRVGIVVLPLNSFCRCKHKRAAPESLFSAQLQVGLTTKPPCIPDALLNQYNG